VIRSLFLFLSISAALAGNDAPLVPPRVLSGAAPSHSETARLWQGIPSIERAKNGRLWATWYSGGTGEGPENYVVLVTSGDDGKTWSHPSLVIEPEHPVRAFDPCLWIDPKGRLWAFWTQSIGNWDGRGGVWSMSTDHPESPAPTWTAPRRLADGVMMNRPTALSSSRWMLAIGGWRNMKINLSGLNTQPRGEMGGEKGSNAYVSTDGLRTVKYAGQARVPQTSFDESMILQRRDKSLWMLVRTTTGIGESVSRDGGKTWSEGAQSGIPHVSSRFHIRRLKSGNLLLIHNVPPAGKGRSHLTASLSLDDGKTWPYHLLLDERNNVSYPDAVEAGDGRIYAIYDRERGKAGEILMAIFHEADIRQPAGGMRLRQVVSQLRATAP
jgi:predicted neuraminidase